MKLNQRGEENGRQSASVILRAVGLMTVSLLCWLSFANPAQAQVSPMTTWTNYRGGRWLTGGNTVWATNQDVGPGLGVGGIGQGTGGPSYAIVFSNLDEETPSSMSGRSIQDINYGAGASFVLNRLVFAPPDREIWLDLNGYQYSLEFTNTAASPGYPYPYVPPGTLPTITMSSTNNVKIYDATAGAGGILVDTNTLIITGGGPGTLTIEVPIQENAALGTVMLTKNGGHTLVLGSSPSYSAGTYINGGTVIWTNGVAPPVGSVTISNDAMLWVKGQSIATVLTYLNPQTFNGSVVADSLQNVDLSGFPSNVSVVAGTSSTYSGSYKSSLSSNTYALGAVSNYTLTVTNVLGNIGGATAFLVGPGGGTVFVTQPNSYSGGTVVRGNTTLDITNDNSLGASSTSLTLSNGGVLEVGDNVALTGRPVTVLGGGNGTGFNLDSGTQLTIDGLLDGSGGFLVKGNGLLYVLNPLNRVGGALYINSGSVSVNGNSLTGAVVTVNVDNGLSLSNATAFTFGGIAGTNLVTWTSVGSPSGPVTALTLGNDFGVPAVYSGSLVNVAITMRGNNEQMLIGTNWFTTTPVITSGVLGFGGSNSMAGIAAQSIAVTNRGALAAGYPINQAFLNWIASPATADGTVALAVESGNPLDFSAFPNLYLGAVYSNIFWTTFRSNIFYNGIITPNGGASGTYRFGGGGGTLVLSGTCTNYGNTQTVWLTSAANILTGARKVLVGNGKDGVATNVGMAWGNTLVDIPPSGSLVLTTNENWTGGTIVTNGGNMIYDLVSGVASAGQSQVTLVGGTLTFARGYNGAAGYPLSFTNYITIPPMYVGNIYQPLSGSIGNKLFGFGGPTQSVLNLFVRGTGNIGDTASENYHEMTTWGDFKGRINVFPDPNAGNNGGTQNMRWFVPAALTNASVHLDTPGVAMWFSAISIDNPLSGVSPNSDFNYGIAGFTNVIGELSGIAGTYVAGCMTTTRSITWRIGDLNTDSTFAGGFVSNNISDPTPNGGGVANLLKVGTGTFTLLGTNAGTQVGALGTFAGVFTAEGGQLVFGYGYSMDPQATLNVQLPNGGAPGVYQGDARGGGIIFSNDTVFSAGGLMGTGNLHMVSVNNLGSLSSMTLTVGVNKANTTYSGNLTDDGFTIGTGSRLVKVGPGVLTLAGSNYISGSVEIKQGTLVFATNFALPPTGALKVADGATVGLYLTNLQPILNRIGPANGIKIAINSAAQFENIDFVWASITNATLIAAQTTFFQGGIAFLPSAGQPISIGAATGATLWFTNSAFSGVSTKVSIDNTGGTVALTDSNVTFVATNNYGGGTVVTSNTLYLAGDGSIGTGPLRLTTNTTLRLANTWSMQNAISMDYTGAIFQVDDGGYVSITNVISGNSATNGGPLKKTGNGVLELDATNTFATGPVVISGVTNQVWALVSAGALVFKNPSVLSSVPDGSLVLGTINFSTFIPSAGSAVGFSVSTNLDLLVPKILGSNTNPCGVAVVLATKNAEFDFNAANLGRMSLTAAQTLTYGGYYTPWQQGGGNGAIYSLAAIVGTTLTYAQPITNFDGSSRLVIGGQAGGFSGTVFVAGNNTFENAAHNYGGSQGYGQVTIFNHGTLYITNDAALGLPGNGGAGTNDRPKGGLVFTNTQGAVSFGPNPPTLRVSNNVTLNNRTVWLDANGDSADFSIQVDPLSTLIITNVIKYSLGPSNRGSLTKSGAGLLWLTASNVAANARNQRLDWNLDGGGLRADWGVSIPTNGFMTISGSPGIDSYLEVSSGILTGQLGNVPYGFRLRRANPSGVSAYGKDLAIKFTEGTAGDPWGITNVNWPNKSALTAAVWAVGVSTAFSPDPLILNGATATASLNWSNNIDLAGQVGVNGGGFRTISVSATNPYVSTLAGYTVNWTNTMGLAKIGVGTLRLTGTNLYNGSTIIASGTVMVAGYGSITNSESIVLGASSNLTLVAGFVTNRVRNPIVDGMGAAKLDVSGITSGGPGTNSPHWASANNAFAIGLARQQTLAGFGYVNGSVVLTNLAIFSPGDTNVTVVTTNVWIGQNANFVTSLPVSGATASTLVFSNNLVFGSGTTLNWDLGATSDLANVQGNLGLGGTLNVRAAPGFPNSGTVTYTLFAYGGALVGGGTLTVGSMPPNTTGSVDIATANIVKLNAFYTNNIPPPDPWLTWQNTYFTPSDPNAAGNVDADGDGMINTNEFLAGTDPTKSSSTLRILSIVTRSGVDGAVTNIITWSASNGDPTNTLFGIVKTNVAQASLGTSSSFTNVFYDASTNFVLQGGTGAVTNNWTDSGGATNKYYRIRLVP